MLWELKSRSLNGFKSCYSHMRACILLKVKNVFRHIFLDNAEISSCGIVLWLSQGFTSSNHKNLMTGRCSSMDQTSKSTSILYMMCIQSNMTSIYWAMSTQSLRTYIMSCVCIFACVSSCDSFSFVRVLKDCTDWLCWSYSVIKGDWELNAQACYERKLS